MAAASVSRPGGAQTTEKSQLILKVVSAKPQSPKLPNRPSRLSSFVEVTADGLSSETKKTGKRSGHLELQWNEDLTLNVTPQSRLDLKLWSCHTLRKELLGSATIDLLDTLRTHHGKMENVQLSLVLQTENKGSVVVGGELNVCLDGMAVDLGTLPNGSAAADTVDELRFITDQRQLEASWSLEKEKMGLPNPLTPDEDSESISWPLVSLNKCPFDGPMWTQSWLKQQSLQCVLLNGHRARSKGPGLAPPGPCMGRINVCLCGWSNRHSVGGTQGSSPGGPRGGSLTNGELSEEQTPGPGSVAHRRSSKSHGSPGCSAVELTSNGLESSRGGVAHLTPPPPSPSGRSPAASSSSPSPGQDALGPAPPAEPGPNPPPNTEQASNSSTEPSTETLPTGVYYVDHNTKTTTWERPLPPGQTHAKGHTLDLVITNSAPISNLLVYDLGVSDHKTISMDMSFQSPLSKPKCKIHFRNLRNINPDTMTLDLQHLSSANFLSVNESVECYNQSLNSLLDLHASLKTRM
ncbi:hypothetical protein JOQ06_002741, partial [Pogonophryne albipinna]